MQSVQTILKKNVLRMFFFNLIMVGCVDLSQKKNHWIKFGNTVPVLKYEKATEIYYNPQTKMIKEY